MSKCASGHLKQLEAQATAAVSGNDGVGVRARERYAGPAKIAMGATEQTITRPKGCLSILRYRNRCKRQLTYAELQAIHLRVCVKQAMSQQHKKLFEGRALKRQRLLQDQVFHAICRHNIGIISLGVSWEKAVPEDLNIHFEGQQNILAPPKRRFGDRIYAGKRTRIHPIDRNTRFAITDDMTALIIH